MSLITIWVRKLASRIGGKARRRPQGLFPESWRRGILFVERLEDRLAPSTFQWTGQGGNSNWTTPGNWQLVSGAGTTPNAIGDVARFTGAIPGGTTVVVDAAITVGEIDFGSASSITINQGAGTLTLDNTGFAATAVLNVGSGPSQTPARIRSTRRCWRTPAEHQ